MKKLMVLFCITALLMMGCVPGDMNTGSDTETDFDKNPVAGVVLSGFETKDLYGSTVNKDFFGQFVLNFASSQTEPCPVVGQG